jgi:hypothetical protein
VGQKEGWAKPFSRFCQIARNKRREKKIWREGENKIVLLFDRFGVWVLLKETEREGFIL